MYSIDVRNAEKKLLIVTSGFFKVDEAQNFIKDLEAKIKTINPKEFDLVIDAREQKASSQDVLPLQQKAIEIYIATPFRSRRSVEFDSNITKAQIQRLGQNELLNNFSFHNSLEDALK